MQTQPVVLTVTTQVLKFTEDVCASVRLKASQSSTAQKTLSTKERLIQFYSQYDSQKLKQVDAIMASFKGREKELLKMLEQAKQKRVVEQQNAPTQDAVRQKVTEYYSKNDKAKLPQVDMRAHCISTSFCMHPRLIIF